MNTNMNIIIIIINITNDEISSWFDVLCSHNSEWEAGGCVRVDCRNCFHLYVYINRSTFIPLESRAKMQLLYKIVSVADCYTISYTVEVRCSV